MSCSSAGVVAYSHVYVASARGPDRPAGVLVQNEAAEFAVDGHPAAHAGKVCGQKRKARPRVDCFVGRDRSHRRHRWGGFRLAPGAYRYAEASMWPMKIISHEKCLTIAPATRIISPMEFVAIQSGATWTDASA